MVRRHLFATVAVIGALLGGLLAATPAAAAPRPWRNAALAPVDRANALLAQMTLAEKITMMHQGAACDYGACVDGNTRLGIPRLRLQDGPAGVADGATGVTQLPAPVAGAATWDTDLMGEYGKVIGAEEWGTPSSRTAPNARSTCPPSRPRSSRARPTGSRLFVNDQQVIGNWANQPPTTKTGSVSGDQNKLVSDVASANPNTVVVVNSGSAVTMPWANAVKGIVENWYPGQVDGTAIAALLYGDVGFSGKLPVTFPQSLAGVPASTPAQWPGQNGTVQYSEGLDVGYRWYDAKSKTPMFPFGYGLSYTTFGYKNLTVGTPDSSGNVAVGFDVTNTGSRAGTEVAQVYVGQPSSAGEPPKNLRGFTRVALDPGQTEHATVTLDARSFQYWNGSGWTTTSGTHQILVGASSRDIRLTGSAQLGASTGHAVSLRARVNSQYVTAENAGAAALIADRASIGPWEEFDLIND